MALYIVAAKATTLKSPLAAADTTVILQAFKDRDGNNLAIASFGEWGTIVVKSGETWELIKFTDITQNADGSATLTVASSGRSLLPITPYTGASTGEDFNAGADVIVTNDPYIMSMFGNLENAQTWNEIQTFAALPATTAGNPVATTDLARKAYVDSVVAGIASTLNLIVPGVAGETLAAGNAVYLKVADGRWWKTDADTATTVENVILGIAQGAGTAGNAIASGVLLAGIDANQSGLTANTKYYFGNTAGAFSTSAGTKEVSAGISHPTDATKLYFFPRYDQQITEDEQDALAGTEGTPSATNKFQTATGVQKQTPVYAASAVGTDSYAITVTPAVSAYSAGMRFTFKADVANTGACTLAVGSGAAKAILKNHDVALTTGDIEANQIVEVAYDAVADAWQMQSPTAIVSATARFGGTGADGALSISSGTTTLDAAGARVLEKNYTSISITGTAKLTISNPHANGTILILRSQGDVTITSSDTAVIDMRLMGGTAGAAQASANTAGTAGTAGKTSIDLSNAGGSAGGGGSNGAGGAGGAASGSVVGINALRIMKVGAGGGGASGGTGAVANDSGAGGRGGGGIIIECGGTYTFTTGTMTTAGSTGAAAATNNAGGGGGGAGGDIVVIATAIGTDTGTYTVSGAAASAKSGSMSGANAGGGGGGGASTQTNGSAGTAGVDSTAPGDGGAGAAGTATRLTNVWLN